MSAPVEDPRPELVVEQRRCPRCGADLTNEQEWCLDCGAGVGATFARPPSWRGPVALVAVLLVVAAAALILALVELAGDAEQVQPAAVPAPTTAPPPTTAPAPTAAPGSTTVPPATETPAPTTAPPEASTGEIAVWPDGTTAWTVVLESSGTEEAAEARAAELAEQGVPVGILESDDYGSLEPGRYVVFSGQYDSQRAADQALAALESQVEGIYVVRVAPE